MNIVWDKKALEHLHKLDNSVVKRIILALDGMSISSKNVKKLKGREGYRLRVGDYRVIFDLIENNTIYVSEVGHRRNIYKN